MPSPCHSLGAIDPHSLRVPARAAGVALVPAHKPRSYSGPTVAQSRRVAPQRRTRSARPLDDEGLERLALFYVGRYATTRAKLRLYLKRKIVERNWIGERPPEVSTLVERLAGLGYVDDSAFAAARSAALQRRGFGERRVAQALAAAGIEAGEADAVREQARSGALATALRFAERRRIGPFAADRPDRAARQKAFAAMNSRRTSGRRGSDRRRLRAGGASSGRMRVKKTGARFQLHGTHDSPCMNFMDYAGNGCSA